MPKPMVSPGHPKNGAESARRLQHAKNYPVLHQHGECDVLMQNRVVGLAGNADSVGA